MYPSIIMHIYLSRSIDLSIYLSIYTPLSKRTVAPRRGSHGLEQRRHVLGHRDRLYLSIYPCIHPSIRLSIHISMHASCYLSIYLSIYTQFLSIYRYIYLFMQKSSYTSIHAHRRATPWQPWPRGAPPRTWAPRSSLLARPACPRLGGSHFGVWSESCGV